MDGSTTTPARLADFGRPGMTAPTSSRIRAVKRTSTTSTTKSGQTSSSSSRNAGPHGNDRGYSVPVDLTSDLMEDQDGQDVNMLHSQQGFKPTTSSMGYSELHLGPATTTSVVTTTTTTTVHFAPILVPRSKPIRPAQSSFSRPDQLPTGPAAVAALLRQDHDDALKLDSKLYPLSQAPFPGGLKRFRLELGDLDATFFEDGRQAAMEAAEASNGQGIESGHEDDGEEYDEESSYKFVGQKQVDKGKGRAVGADADLAFARGPLQQRRLSRRSVRTVQQQHTRPHQQTPQQPRRSSSSEEEEQMSADDGPGQQDTPGGSPGPPRKRPRSGSAQRRASNASDVTHAAALTTGATLFSAGNLGLTSNVTAAALPSPTNSPPSPVPTFAGDDEKQDSDQSVLSPDQHQFDLGSGTALSGLLSLPDFVNTFDQLSPALQSYFIYTFLKRSPIPVLQTINSIVTPALRRDFLTDLPPELGLHIFSFLDAQTLCCASQVSRSWRRLADGEWRVWEQRLIEDGLWIGDGSEEQEAREIMTGSKENLFLKRWRAGVWDQPPRTSWTGRVEDDVVLLDAHSTATSTSARRASQSVKLASPSSSRETSPALPLSHPTDPYKTLYRRRYETRRNWREKQPKRTTFACNANNVVTCLQFDKDKIVSASDDHSINVFDTQTGATKARLQGHDGGVWALQYIGNVLVSGSTDRTVRVWDLDRARCTHTFVGHTSTVRCLQIVEPEDINPDPNGDPIWEPPYPLIVTGSRDWSLRVWKLPAPGKDAEYHPVVPQSPTEDNTDPSDNPYHLRHLAGHRHAVRALAAHGNTLVSGSYDCQVRVWDIMTGACRHRLVGHTQKVYSVVYDHRRQQCASGSMDGTVRLWSTSSGECIATLDGHSSLVGLLGLSSHNLVSAAADSTLRIWDPATGECRHTLAAHSGAITCFQHDDYKVISGSDGTLKMWDVRDGSFTRDLMTGLTGVWQVAFSQRFCVAAVQRNGQSEFTILDFGPVDEAEIREEEEREQRIQKRLRFDLDVTAADDVEMTTNHNEERFFGASMPDSLIPVPTITAPSASTLNASASGSGSASSEVPPPAPRIRQQSTMSSNQATTTPQGLRRAGRSLASIAAATLTSDENGDTSDNFTTPVRRRSRANLSEVNARAGGPADSDLNGNGENDSVHMDVDSQLPQSHADARVANETREGHSDDDGDDNTENATA